MDTAFGGRLVIARMFRWFDDRLGAASFARRTLNKVFPDHWSFMLGEIALYCFIVLVLTGTFLAFFYVPDSREVVYRGSYAPLYGQHISTAYKSVLRLSFEVRAGLVFRQIHHWAALVMAGAVTAHATRIFFTGAFRKPRDLNWILGVTLLLLTLAIGFTGYSLPDDLLSGTGIRIMYSLLLSIPFIGTWTAFLFFGGEYPAPDLLHRLFVIHIFILPLLIGAVIAAHLAIIWHQKHTHFPGHSAGQPERTERNIQGERLYPRYAFKSMGLFLAIAGVLSLMGGLLQINPIWLYGPYNAHIVSGGSQPDWYMGWLEGALRLFPNWELHVFGHEVPEPFFPAVLFPAIVFLLMFLWPAIERRLTGDRETHHLLNFPRDVPWRTAFGAGVLVFFAILTIAGGNDLIAAFFRVSVEAVTRLLRVLIFVLPLLTFAVTYWLCNELRRSGMHPVRGSKIDEVRRTATGGFETADETEGGGFRSAERV
ncbi:MAG: cytochrome bc complex cytochrome b subunit [Actinomycetota bacterium]